MDAVIQGIVGGSVASLLIVIGGAIAVFSGSWEKMTVGLSLFIWLALLTALTVGQVFLTYTISTALAATPSQTEKGVVQ
jgi:hypothetical protein